MKPFNLLLLLLIQWGFISAQHKTYPKFNTCFNYYANDTIMAEECSELAFELFLGNVKESIYKNVGGSFNDTVSLELNFTKKGKIKVNKISGAYLNISGELLEANLKNLVGNITPRPYNISRKLTIVFGFDTLPVVDIREIESPTPHFSSLNFLNKAGKVSILQVGLVNALADLYRRKYDGFSEFDVLFDRTGKYLGVKFLSPVGQEQKRINDSILMIVNNYGSNFLHSLELEDTIKNTYYALRHHYFYFDSEIDMRLYFKRLAPKYLAQGDTNMFFTNLMSVASTYHYNKNLVGYIKDIVVENNLSVKDSFEFRNKTVYLKDLVDNKEGYFRTNERVENEHNIISYFPVCEKYISTDIFEEEGEEIVSIMQDSLWNCVSETMIDLIQDTLSIRYGTNFLATFLTSKAERYYRPKGNEYFEIAARDTTKALYGISMILVFDEKGNIREVKKLTCSPHFAHLLEEQKRLTRIVKNVQGLPLELIDSITRLPALNPGVLNGKAYKPERVLNFYALMNL